MLIRRTAVAATLLILLLFSWLRTFAGTQGNASRPDTSPWQLAQTLELRPRLLDKESGAVLWEGPPLAHVFIRADGRPAWVPTGTETDLCAQPIDFIQARAPLTSTTCRPRSLRAPRPLSRPTNTTPPATIRVLHSPYNTCRNAAPGQIDVIPLEEYVARVLPAEMPASWPMEALKAQAIAIRTYAWYQILKGSPDYDVTDWTDYQVMCDRRHPRSDEATQATRGQALFYNGAPILAMYSAQNGHPTRGVDWLPYLDPVPDPVALGHARYGHGYGLSQWGAHDWSLRGWNAYQILAHYYPNAILVQPPDAPAPVGSLLPPELEDMTLGRGYPLTLLAAFPQAPRVLTVTAHTVEGLETTVLTRTGTVGFWVGTWTPPATFSSTHPITLTATVEDGEGRVWPLGEAHIWRDLRSPTITLTLPTDTVNPTFPFTVVTHTPPDIPPQVGVSEGWLWEEAAFYHTAGASVVTDTEALDGQALVLPPQAQAYGPYTNALPSGRAYRAWFRLSTTATTRADTVVFLDVVADGGQTLLGLRALRGIEFPGPGQYREYPVDFYLFGSSSQPPSRMVEFRVHALGAPVRLDRVLVTSYPRTWSGYEETWTLPKRGGKHLLIAKQTTPTGLTSADIPLPITLHVPHPAMTLTAQVPARWITENMTYPWFVTTAVAPPDADTFFTRFRKGDGPWSAWQVQKVTVTSERSGTAWVRTDAYPDGKSIFVALRGADRFTYEGEQVAGPFRVDRHPPRVTLEFSHAPRADGWYTVPLTITVVARDEGIGVLSVSSRISTSIGTVTAYRVQSAGPRAVITQTLPLRQDADYTVHIEATDALSHTRTITRHIVLDTSPPQTALYAPSQVHRPWAKLRWLGEDAHAIVGYDVDVRVADGPWHAWLRSVSLTWGWYEGRPGQRVAFRARAHDAAGWVGPWSRAVTLQFPHTQFLPLMASSGPM